MLRFTHPLALSLVMAVYLSALGVGIFYLYGFVERIVHG